MPHKIIPFLLLRYHFFIHKPNIFDIEIVWYRKRVSESGEIIRTKSQYISHITFRQRTNWIPFASGVLLLYNFSWLQNYVNGKSVIAWNILTPCSVIIDIQKRNNLIICFPKNVNSTSCNVDWWYFAVCLYKRRSRKNFI